MKKGYYVKKLKRDFMVGVLVTSIVAGCFGCGKQTASTVTDSAASTTQTAEETQEADATESGENTVKASEEKAYALCVTQNNSWQNGDLTCTQFDGVIKNQTGEGASDWKVTLTVPEGASVESGWNGDYEINGTTLTIIPVDYNKEIAGNSEISFGFIIDTKTSFSLEQGSLSIAGAFYALNDNEKSEDFSEGKEETTSESTTQESTQKEEKEVATKDTTGTPVANHGKLSVKGTDIVDKDGKIYQLKGVSTHGIGWFPDYVNEDAFASLSQYGVNAIRLAMYTAEGEGYCTGGNPEKLEGLVEQGVEACKNLGLYVIIDWHVLQDLDPNVYKDSAKAFFAKMAEKYANYDNVIYEICNEPNGGTSWESVKSYAEEVIPVIREYDKDALIIVGTPNWSQDVDVAAGNPITGQENILYAVHFYASTHKDNIRNKVVAARDKGLAVIISECSICEASGNGSIDYSEAEKWMDLINSTQMSCFCWNLSNKDEQSSILKSSVTKTSGFSMDDFSETGKWFMEQFGK